MLDRFFAGLFDVLTLLGCLFGGFLVFQAMLPGNSAPQQGALAAVGIGCAAIPYFLSGIVHRAIVRKAMTGEPRDI